MQYHNLHRYSYRTGISPRPPLGTHFSYEARTKGSFAASGFEIAQDFVPNKHRAQCLMDRFRPGGHAECPTGAPQQIFIKIMALALDGHAYAYSRITGIWLYRYYTWRL